MSVEILIGNCRERLAEIEADSVDCVVTSPPYLGLRDYGIEPVVWSGDAACAHEWGEEGKSAQRLRNGEGSTTAKQAVDITLHPSTGQFCTRCGAWRGSLGLEPTPELFVEHIVEVFRAVRRVLKPSGTVWLNIGDSYAAGHGGSTTAGNYIPKTAVEKDATPRSRSDVDVASWSNRDTTPKRVIPGLKPKDLMMVPARVALALQADGWWIRSETVWAKPNPMPESVTDRPTSAHEKIFLLTKAARYWYDADAVREDSAGGSRIATGDKNYRGVNGRECAGGARSYQGHTGRNLRNVWTIATQPYPQAHFATFPVKLAERCILAGCPPGGLVLDPFGGAGTVAVAAEGAGRRAVLIEINPEYAAMATARLRAGLARVESEAAETLDHGPLFAELGP